MAPAPPSALIHCLVYGDAINPGLQSRFATKAAQPAIDLQKGFLGRVPRFFGVPQQSEAEGEHRTFELGDKLSQREGGESYQVYIPSLKKAEADRKAAELKSLGTADLAVVQDDDPSQFTVSLGVFKTEEAAANYLAQLTQKGVRSAVSRPRGAKTSIFVIRDPGDAIAAKIAGLKTEFPAATLRAAACTDAQQSAKSQ